MASTIDRPLPLLPIPPLTPPPTAATTAAAHHLHLPTAISHILHHRGLQWVATLIQQASTLRNSIPLRDRLPCPPRDISRASSHKAITARRLISSAKR